MKEITLVFTKSKKKFPIISWLIRLYTNKPYSHVARYKNILGEPLFYQSNEVKVNYEHEDVFTKKHEIVKVYKIEVDDDMERKMSRRCLMSVGRKYALKQNIGVMVVDFFKLFGKVIKNPWKDGENCSEAIARSVLFYKYPELRNKYNADTIKPHHIENILISKGYKSVNKYK